MSILRCITGTDLFSAKQEKIQSKNDVKTKSWGKRECFPSGSNTNPKIRKQCSVPPEGRGAKWPWHSAAFLAALC